MTGTGTGFNRFGQPCRGCRKSPTGNCGRCTGGTGGAAAGASGGNLDAAVDAAVGTEQPDPVTGGRNDDQVQPVVAVVKTSSLEFAEIMQSMRGVARLVDLEMPVFGAPPGNPNSTRSITRPDGQDRKHYSVRVRLAGRANTEVKGDMVDGLIAANPHVPETKRRALRDLLLNALDSDHPERQMRAETYLAGTFKDRLDHDLAEAS